MPNKFSDENRRIKGRVIRNRKGQKTYTDRRGGELMEDKPEWLGGFEQVANPSRRITKSNTMRDDNPLSWMEYRGDRIGKIHIAAMIPHWKRKKKRGKKK